MSLKRAGVEQLLSGKANAWRNRARVVLDLFSNLKFVRSSGLLLVNLWGQVIIQRGQILVSITDDATLRVLCCVLCVCACALSWCCGGVSIQNHRVSIQNVPVCTFKTLPCVPAKRAHVETSTHGGFESTHRHSTTTTHTHTPQHTHTHQNTRHNTTQRHDHNTTRRQRETETERERKKTGTEREEKTAEERQEKRRQKKTKQDKTGEDKTRQECKEKRESETQDKTRMQREERRWKREDGREEKRRSRQEKIERRQEERKRRGKMKEEKKFPKMFQDPSNPPDELVQHVSRKNPRQTNYFLIFSFESSESDRVFNYLHDSNSIFRARGINSEWFFGRTVHIETELNRHQLRTAMHHDP